MYCNPSRNAPGACPGDSTPHSHPPPWRTQVASHGCPAVDPRRAGSPPRTCFIEVPQGAALWRWLGPPRLMMMSERLHLRLLPRWNPSVPCASLKTEGNTRPGVRSVTVACPRGTACGRFGRRLKGGKPESVGPSFSLAF